MIAYVNLHESTRNPGNFAIEFMDYDWMWFLPKPYRVPARN